MRNTRKTHETAMRYSHLAMQALEKGNYSVAQKLYERAYMLENRCLRHFRIHQPDKVHSQSVLAYSTACLAYKGGLMPQCKELIAQALEASANLPPTYKEKFLELKQQVEVCDIAQKNGN